MPEQRVKRNLVFLLLCLFLLVLIGIPLAVDLVANGSSFDLDMSLAYPGWAIVVVVPVLFLLVGLPIVLVTVLGHKSRKNRQANE